ncbi:hypothetical protein HCZ30_16410 [Marivivens donghaensis]|uniref:Sulfotransferase domain-containing protein n=1 Tax=Marivivens donghaensis TaxID=1699413 RepID=A0ABX0W148_9RHOB|nr:hypothetical protein [Marivivens donghaensis]NIY74009.1 hypothetical protein [Marivivens donghaensis]
MKKYIADNRRKIQLAINSQFGRLQPNILANSVPKSGTHLLKAILEGNGYKFVGHYNDQECGHLDISQERNRYFSTAHLNTATSTRGTRLLVYRDPADVALSMAIYLRNRWYHPQHKKFSSIPLADCVDLVFHGTQGLRPLWETYENKFKWANSVDAIGFDFSFLKSEPDKIFRVIGDNDVDLFAINRSINRWNPTKRSKRDPHEDELKREAQKSQKSSVIKCFDIYKKMTDRLSA